MPRGRSCLAIRQARLQGGRAAFPRFKASEVQRRTWVAEYLAVDEFQQLHLGRCLFQFFDDFGVLVGCDARNSLLLPLTIKALGSDMERGRYRPLQHCANAKGECALDRMPCQD